MANDYFNCTNVEGLNYKVVGGIMSPVSDAYGKASLISAAHRVEMCRLACEGHPFINVEPWEAFKSEWTPTLDVLKYFDAEIKKDPECSKVKLMLLLGSDLVDSFKHAHIWDPENLKDLIVNFGLAIIERRSYEQKSSALESEIFESNLLYPLRRHIYIIPQMVPNDVSSSKLRLLIRRGHSIKYLTCDSVIGYIQANNLYPRD